MNILWFNWKDGSNPAAGGAEVINEGLAGRLAEDGHRVTFIVAGFVGGAAESNHHGYRVIRVGSRFTSYFAAYRYYRQHHGELAPDLVIDECNTMPFFAGRYTGTPTVLFFHMLCRRIWFYEFPWLLGLIGFLAEPIYLRLLKRAPVIAMSDSTKRDLIRQGFRDRDITVISEAINLEPLPKLPPDLKFAKPTLLALGSIHPMKRTFDQIRAFELAKGHVPDLKLVIAGAAARSYGQKVQAAISRSPYAKSIRYLGPVSHSQKLELLQRAHVILLTSVKEGWALTVTEAASQGTPAVVYDVDGLRDSVQDGQTGLVTRTNNPAAMAVKIEELLGNPDLYERLRQNGWKWSREFTFDRSYQEFKRALQL